MLSVVIFNGPPGAGKDAACDFYQRLGFKHLSFKEELFKETFEFFGVSKDWFMKGYENRSIKEKPVPQLKINGQIMSRRDAMIYVSENYIKPKYGNDYFGNQLSLNIKKDDSYCVSDGGFIEELHPVINTIGVENVVLIQLTRNGCDYSSDSRRYFDGNLIQEFVIGHHTTIKDEHVLNHKFPVRMYRIHNNGTIPEFENSLEMIYEKEKNAQQRHEARESTKSLS